jgi:hypothetical protein
MKTNATLVERGQQGAEDGPSFEVLRGVALYGREALFFASTPCGRKLDFPRVMFP